MTVTPSELSQLPPLIGVEQACALLGISRSAGYRAAATGDLPTIRLGRRLYVPTARVSARSSAFRWRRPDEGSIKKRGSTYTYVVDIGPDPLTGKQQRTKGGSGPRRSASRPSTMSSRRRGPAFVEPAKRTVESFLVEEWLPARPPRVREINVVELPAQHREPHRPGPRPRETSGLTPRQLTAFYRHLLTSGRRDGKGGLAPKTVKNIHATLHPALAVAMRWGYVVRNVADAVDLPKVITPEMQSGARAAPRVP